MTPTNEIETIVLFAQQAEAAGFKIISIRAKFPDAIIEYAGQRYRAEFEYQATNFRDHGHDPSRCDLIFCWEDNWPGAPLPVIAGADGWKHSGLSLAKCFEKERDYWRNRAINAEKALSPEVKNPGGRPRKPIDRDKVAYYVEKGPADVSRREAKEVLGLSRDMHYRHREVAENTKTAT